MHNIGQIYDQIADDYALKRRHPGAKMKLAKIYLLPGMRVLDLGCGPGRFYELIPENSQYVGLDLSKKLLAIARRNYPRAKFLWGDMSEEKDWQSLGQFDAIFSFASFHHLMSKIKQTEVLKLCYHHLKKGGILLIVVWNLLNYKEKKVIKPWKLSDGRKAIKTVKRPYYTFTPLELKKLVETAGFSVKKTFFIENKEFGIVAKKC